MPSRALVLTNKKKKKTGPTPIGGSAPAPKIFGAEHTECQRANKRGASDRFLRGPAGECFPLSWLSPGASGSSRHVKRCAPTSDSRPRVGRGGKGGNMSPLWANASQHSFARDLKDRKGCGGATPEQTDEDSASDGCRVREVGLREVELLSGGEKIRPTLESNGVPGVFF